VESSSSPQTTPRKCVVGSTGARDTHAVARVRGDLGESPPHALVLGRRQSVVYEEFPLTGPAEASTTVEEIYDVGTGALAVVRTTLAGLETAPTTRRTYERYLCAWRRRPSRLAAGLRGMAHPRRPASNDVARRSGAISRCFTGCRGSEPTVIHPTLAAPTGFERPILRRIGTTGSRRVSLSTRCVWRQ
jgi:hypothetical protein